MTLRGTSGGKRLRALRNYYGKTQLQVELDASLGTGYLQRIETGKVQQPEQDTLERILGALGAQYSERRELLEMFGYLVDAPIPSRAAIEWAVGACAAELESAVFPAYLLDCAHRLLTWNRLVPHIFDLARIQRRAAAEYASALKIVFDEAYGFAPRILNRDPFFQAQIRALRYERQRFQEEDWYQALIEEMMSLPTFARYWTRYPARETLFAARPLTLLSLDCGDAGVLQFRLLSESFAQDKRFRVIYYLPADGRTIAHALRWVEAGK